ncbi:tape measure protein [Candidatus Pacearchaeota archaeon]|nr:tape measure protein [Candidatus Pacearchaeota archaeon]
MLNRLRVVTTNQWQLNRAMQAMYDISLDTRSGLASNVEMYARTAINTKHLGIEQERLIGFTKSLRQAIALSGVTAREADWGMIQLSQGMSAGALRGDELRSVMEQLPVVADVLAKSMGVTRGELRYLAFQSKVTTQVMIRAFEEARQELEDRFAKRIPTLSEGVGVLASSVLKYVGQSDQALGVTRSLAALMQSAARSMNVIGPIIAGVGAGLLTLVLRFTALKALLLVSPGGWIAAAIAGAAVATVALISHWDEISVVIGRVHDNLVSLGIPIQAVVDKTSQWLSGWKTLFELIKVSSQMTPARVSAMEFGIRNPNTVSGLSPEVERFWAMRRAAMAAGDTAALGNLPLPGARKIGPHEQAALDALRAKSQKAPEELASGWQPTIEQQTWFASLQRPLDDYMSRLEAVEGFTNQVTEAQELYTRQLLEGQISQQEHNKLMGEAEVKLQTLRDATRELIRATDDNAAANNQAYVDGLKSIEQYQRASAQLWLKSTEGATDYGTGLKRGLTEVWLKATNDAEQMQDAVGNVFSGMSDMVTDFVTKGKVDFSGFVDSVLADLTRMLTNKLIMAPLMQGLGLSGAGAGVPGKAGGGWPPVDRPVWMGENGPEIFKPSQAGAVVPHEEAMNQGSGGDVTIIYVDSMDQAYSAMQNAKGRAIILNTKERRR